VRTTRSDDDQVQSSRVGPGEIVNPQALLGVPFSEHVVHAEVVQPNVDDVHALEARRAQLFSRRASAGISAAVGGEADRIYGLKEDKVDETTSDPDIARAINLETRQPALLLKMSRATFQRQASTPGYEHVEPMLRRVAMRVSRLLTLEGMQDSGGGDGFGEPRRPNKSREQARSMLGIESDEENPMLDRPSRLPDLLTQTQLQVLARRQQVEVYSLVSEVVLDFPSYSADAQAVGGYLQPRDSDPQSLFFVVEGQLEAVCMTSMSADRQYKNAVISGKQRAQSDGGSALSFTSFCTPYDQKLIGDTSMPIVIHARVKEAPCVVVWTDLKCTSKEALERFKEEQEAMFAEQKRREEILEQLVALTQQLKLIQQRLGTLPVKKVKPGVIWRESEIGKALWLWAIKTYRTFKRFKVDMRAPRTGGVRKATLDDQLFEAQEALLKAKVDQQSRVEQFEAILNQWREMKPYDAQTMQPDQLSEIERDVYDAEAPFTQQLRTVEQQLTSVGQYIQGQKIDLTPARLAKVDDFHDGFIAVRKVKHTGLMERLESLWNFVEWPLHRRPQFWELTIDGLESVKAEIDLVVGDKRSEVAMALLQPSLDELWRELQLPAEEREQLRWQVGMPLTEQLLVTCIREVALLKTAKKHVQPLVEANKDDPDLLTHMLASLMPVVRRVSSEGASAQHAVEIAMAITSSGMGSSRAAQAEMIMLKKQHAAKEREHEQQIEAMREDREARMAELEELGLREKERAAMERQRAALAERQRIISLQENNEERKRAEAELRAEMERLDAQRRAELEKLEAEKRAEAERLEAEKHAEAERLKFELKEEKRKELERMQAAAEAEMSQLHAEKQADATRLEEERRRLEEERRAEVEQLVAKNRAERDALEAEKRAEVERVEAEKRAQAERDAAEREEEMSQLKKQQTMKNLHNKLSTEVARKQDELRKVYEPLLMEHTELVQTGEDALRMLGITEIESRWGQFQEVHHAHDFPLPSEVDEDNIFNIRRGLPNLRRVVEGLCERRDTDAIALSLRNVASRSCIKPTQLAMQMTKGPNALLDPKLNDREEFSRAQFDHFLARKEIDYTEKGMAYFLQSVGSAPGSKKPIKVKRLTSVMDQKALAVDVK